MPAGKKNICRRIKKDPNAAPCHCLLCKFNTRKRSSILKMKVKNISAKTYQCLCAMFKNLNI